MAKPADEPSKFPAHDSGSTLSWINWSAPEVYQNQVWLLRWGCHSELLYGHLRQVSEGWMGHWALQYGAGAEKESSKASEDWKLEQYFLSWAQQPRAREEKASQPHHPDGHPHQSIWLAGPTRKGCGAVWWWSQVQWYYIWLSNWRLCQKWRHLKSGIDLLEVPDLTQHSPLHYHDKSIFENLSTRQSFGFVWLHGFWAKYHHL